MTAANFGSWFSWMEQNFEGDPLHITPGDEGGATAFGWTYSTWEGFAKLHRLDSSFAHFTAMKQNDFELPTRLAFWNCVKADQLPAGVDVIWADFQFGSFHGTEVLQTVLGIEADNSVGPQTIQAAWSVNDRKTLLSRMTVARKAYYQTLGTYAEFGNGWNRRSDECLSLAQRICGFAVAPLPIQPQMSADDLNAAELQKVENT